MDVILLCFAMALLAADVIFLHLRTNAVEGSVKTLWKDSKTTGEKFRIVTGYYEKLSAKTAAKKPVKKGKKK